MNHAIKTAAENLHAAIRDKKGYIELETLSDVLKIAILTEGQSLQARPYKEINRQLYGIPKDPPQQSSNP